MSLVRSIALKNLKSFRNDESGTATVEFIFLLPAFMVFFTWAFESGLHSTRQVMLERGLDVAVRDVRIGRLPTPSHDALSERICEVASIIPDCLNQLRLEMAVRDPRAWNNVSDQVQCVDREEEGNPVLEYTGLNNELMILRVCSLFDPMMPAIGLGTELPTHNGGAYALVATSSYVMEPFQ